MIIFYGLLLFWIVCGILGTPFIQYSLFGVNPFYALLGAGIVCFVLSLIYNKKIPQGISVGKNVTPYKRWLTSVKIYTVLYFLYIFLSYAGVFKSLNLVEYQEKYIFRHAYLVFSFPVVYLIIDTVCRYSDGIVRFFKDYYLLVIIWAVYILLGESRDYDAKVFRAVAFALASLVYCSRPRSVLSLLILLFTVVRCCSVLYSTTSMLCVVIALFALIFDKDTVDLLKKKTGLIIFGGLALIVLALTLVTCGYYTINDSNSMWRLQYWVNELKTLVKTGGFGVGFGTAYGSESIYSEINNPYVFSDQAAPGTGLFVITQHSSLVNAFYRLGLIGGICFIFLIIINPIKWYTRRQLLNKKYYPQTRWAFANYIFNLVIILINPGLESPPFFMGFLMSYGFLIGFLIRSTNDYCNKCEFLKGKSNE